MMREGVRVWAETGRLDPIPLQYSPPNEQGEQYEESSMMVLQKMITGKTGKEE